MINYKNIFFLSLLVCFDSCIQQKQLVAAATEEKKESILLQLKEKSGTENLCFESRENATKYGDFNIPENSRIIKVAYKNKEGQILKKFGDRAPLEDLFLLTDPTITLEELKTNKELTAGDRTPYIIDITSYYKKNGEYNNPFRWIGCDAHYSEEGKKQLAQAIAEKQADEEIFEAHVCGDNHFYQNVYLVKKGIDFKAEMAYYDFIHDNPTETEFFGKSHVTNVTADYDAQGNKIEKKKEDPRSTIPNEEQTAHDPKKINKTDQKEHNSILTMLLAHKGKISGVVGMLAIGTTINRAYNKALANKKINEATTLTNFANKVLQEAFFNPFKTKYKTVAASVWITIAALAGCSAYDYAKNIK